MPKKGNVPPLVRNCARCGAEYRAWPYEAANGRKYCGYSCRSKARAAPLETRFWAKTAPWRGCLIWTGTGLPRINVGGRVTQAPRVAYELTYGPVPPRAHVRHLCRHTFCVNPEHLAITFDPATPAADRFWAKVQMSDGCWLWTGGHDEAFAYGVTSVDGVRVRTHRRAWELTYGPIPPGLFVCHRCDVRACVRPDHLFLGTPADNLHDMWAKGRGFIPHRRGEANNKARLTVAQVQDLRRQAAAGASFRSLAAAVGVTHGTVSAAVNRKTWKHVP
jgi:hypothetical protein